MLDPDGEEEATVNGWRGRRGLTAAVATCLVLAGAALAPVSAGAATRWAEPGGDGPVGTCPQSNPCGIADAIGHIATEPGDLVLLKAGDYLLGATTVYSAAPNMTIRPAPGAGRPTITSNGAAAFDLTNATLQDVRVQAFDAGGTESAITARAGVALDRLVVEAFGTTPAAITGSDGALVRNSVVTNANWIAVRGAGSGMTVQGSALLAIEETGVGFDANTSWGPFQTATIVNSIVSGDTADIRADDHHVDTQDIDVNVRFSNFDLAVEVGTDAAVNEGPGNQSEQALLVDRAGRDLRQLPGSPTIGAGTNTPMTPFALGPLDFELNPRVQGGVDIGADEATDPAGLVRLIRKRVKPRRGLRIRAKCPPADCELTVTGRLRLPGPDPRTRMDAEELDQGDVEGLVLRIGSGKLRRLRNALPQARLIVKVHAEDPLGFETDLVRRFRFTRPR